MALNTLLSSLLILVALAGAVLDLRSGLIPNRLTLPAVALALIVRLAAGGGAALVEGCLGLLLTSIGPWIVFRATRGAGIGGGDLKLFAALGALAGPTAGLQLLAGSCILLVLYGLLLLAWRGRIGAALVQSIRIILSTVLPSRFGGGIPQHAVTSLRMGPFIAVATLVVAAAPWLASILPWPAPF